MHKSPLPFFSITLVTETVQPFGVSVLSLQASAEATLVRLHHGLPFLQMRWIMMMVVAQSH